MRVLEGRRSSREIRSRILYVAGMVTTGRAACFTTITLLEQNKNYFARHHATEDVKSTEGAKQSEGNPFGAGGATTVGRKKEVPNHVFPK